MISRLQARLETLYGLERRKAKLGLEGTRTLLGALGDPQRRFRAVHVAGTNGKGSVCAIVERVLREAGVRTGLFTSPHLVDFRERIRVNGRWADAEWLDAALDRIEALPEGRDRTFFEVATALGFLYFAERGVEWAVVEVGLGGRLDTTNVLEPAVCAITSIGLDHTEILGDTLEQIAAEKAGIIKPGVPVVIGELPEPALRVIRDAAADRRAPLVEPVAAAPGVQPEGWKRLNGRVALTVLGVLASHGVPVSPAALQHGLAGARWPGRAERAPGEPRLWWDGAHNASGVRTLREAWAAASRTTVPGPRAIVLALSRDKDVDQILRELRAGFAGAAIVACRSRSERAMEPATIAERARGLGFQAVEASDVAGAIRRALDLAGDAPVLLTGSLFAVGEAMEVYGGAPGEQL